MFAMSLTAKTKLKGLLEILASASEFDEVPVRHHEDALLETVRPRPRAGADATSGSDEPPRRLGRPPEVAGDGGSRCSCCNGCR